MAIRVFPVPETTGWSDTFGAPRGGGRTHEGQDIFAAKGARVLAVDDGIVRTAQEGTGGTVVYQKTDDGALSYYAHLDTWSDAMPPAGGDYSVRVKAGDLLGTVGNTGNARTTPPHLHFQYRPPGSSTFTNPADALRAAQAGTTPAPAPPSTTPGTDVGRRVTAPLLAKALRAAWKSKHGTTEPDSLSIALAQALGEGSTSELARGTNNVGSMHATRDFARAHASDAHYGTFALLDVSADGFYIGRFMIFPSLFLGASAFLARVENDVDLATVQTPADYAAQLYIGGYYTMTHKPVTPLAKRREAARAGTLTTADAQNIAEYAAIVESTWPGARAAMAAADSEPRDPKDITSGAPFAPLADRLTSQHPPHTMENARKLLGARADHPPPGALSLAEALAAPNGDGVWLYPLEAKPKPAPVPSPSSSKSASAGETIALALLALVTGVSATAGLAVVARRYERRRAA